MYQLFKKFVTVFFLVAILCLPYFVFAETTPDGVVIIPIENIADEVPAAEVGTTVTEETTTNNVTATAKTPTAGPLGVLSSIGSGAGYAQGDGSAVFSVAGSLITAGLSLIGILFLVLMIYGGFLWMTDRGNEAQVKKAQKMIEAAVIGIIIVVSAYAITQFVNSYIIKSSGGLQ